MVGVMRVYLLALIVVNVIVTGWLLLVYWGSLLALNDLKFEVVHGDFSPEQASAIFGTCKSFERALVVPAVLLSILWLIGGIVMFRGLNQKTPVSTEKSIREEKRQT